MHRIAASISFILVPFHAYFQHVLYMFRKASCVPCVISFDLGWTSTWCCDGRLAKPAQSAGPLAGHERAEFRSRSILSNSRASASAASPARNDNGIAHLGSFCRSFFNQNFQSNFHPILMRFCLQHGLQDPPKIHTKSISRVS